MVKVILFGIVFLLLFVIYYSEQTQQGLKLNDYCVVYKPIDFQRGFISKEDGILVRQTKLNELYLQNKNKCRTTYNYGAVKYHKNAIFNTHYY